MTVTTIGPFRGFGVQLAEVFQRGRKAGDADGKAGGRNVLPREPLYEAVIAPAACDGAELDDLALFVGNVSRISHSKTVPV